MSRRSFHPYIVIYSRAASPDDHVAFELGARNAKKAVKASRHLIKVDKELDKLGLLVHRATFRILGEYDVDAGGEGLAVADLDEMADISFEEVTRMCGMWIIDNQTLKRVDTEDMFAPIDSAAKSGSKALAVTGSKESEPKQYALLNPFTIAVIDKCSEIKFKYEFNNRKEVA